MNTARYAQAGRVIALTESAMVRLDNLVEVSSLGCWPWTGRLDRHGYGVFKPMKGTLSLAHRAVYQLLNDVLLDPEQQIDHLCRNRACCNPAHMEIVTNRENKIRGEIALGRRRQVGGRCSAGHLLDESNAYQYRDQIRCRRCHALTSARHRAKG